LTYLTLINSIDRLSDSAVDGRLARLVILFLISKSFMCAWPTDRHMRRSTQV